MREKVLVFGANFPLATRIADLFRREFDVTTYNFSSFRDSGQVEVDTAFTGDLLSSALTSTGASYVLFTSESLLYVHSEAMLNGLLDELQACKRHAGIHLAYVDIAEPIVVGSGQVIHSFKSDSAYAKRLAILRESLTGVADSVLQVNSVYSPENDLWGQNFLHLLFDAKEGTTVEVVKSSSDWEPLSADEVAQTLVSRLNRAGTQHLSHGPYPGGLEAFCATVTAEFMHWSDVQIARWPHVDANERSVVPQKSEPVQAGLHAVTRQARCAVNYLYRKAPEDAFGRRSIAQFRFELGNALARSIPQDVVASVDMIVPVPETGKIYAQGLASALGLPYEEVIYKSDRKRSFDIESFDERREFLFSRLNVVPGLLMGKSVIVVDEAIFTGATLKVVSHLLQQAGAVRVFFAIPSPEARYECKFNMQPKRNLLSEYVRKDDLWSYFNVQAVYFQDDVTFIHSIEQDGPQCVACFIQRGRND
jgi:adenine/guanine phosphoribosyltransferase-like PRPP-binding protein